MRAAPASHRTSQEVVRRPSGDLYHMLCVISYRLCGKLTACKHLVVWQVRQATRLTEASITPFKPEDGCRSVDSRSAAMPAPVSCRVLTYLPTLITQKDLVMSLCLTFCWTSSASAQHNDWGSNAGGAVEMLTSGSPLLGAGSNCRKFFLICSSTSMMAAMFPAPIPCPQCCPGQHEVLLPSQLRRLSGGSLHTVALIAGARTIFLLCICSMLSLVVCTATSCLQFAACGCGISGSGI